MGWPSWGSEREQRYDLGFDPNGCARDLQPPLEPGRGRAPCGLELRMRETDDQLLDGPVPLPPGAWINSPDQRSASDPTAVPASAA